MGGPWQSRAGPSRFVQGRAGMARQDQRGSDRAGQDQAGSGRAGQDQAGSARDGRSAPCRLDKGRADQSRGLLDMTGTGRGYRSPSPSRSFLGGGGRLPLIFRIVDGSPVPRFRCPCGPSLPYTDIPIPHPFPVLLTMPGFAQSCPVLTGPSWPRLVLFGLVRHCLTFPDTSRPCTDLSCATRPGPSLPSPVTV